MPGKPLAVSQRLHFRFQTQISNLQVLPILPGRALSHQPWMMQNRVVIMNTMAGTGKGDRSNLCEAPSGPFRQIGPVPFPRGRQSEQSRLRPPPTTASCLRGLSGGKPGRSTALSKQRIQIGMLAVLALVALRLALGCHFLYEGLWKVKRSDFRHDAMWKSEKMLGDEFTAAPFLTTAKGPIAGSSTRWCPTSTPGSGCVSRWSKKTGRGRTSSTATRLPTAGIRYERSSLSSIGCRMHRPTKPRASTIASIKNSTNT